MSDADELAELQVVFDLRWRADMRAIKRWQEATGRTMVWPDHADLCVWLLEQLDAERERCAKVAETLFTGGDKAVVGDEIAEAIRGARQ